jgi:hypothetical protein
MQAPNMQPPIPDAAPASQNPILARFNRRQPDSLATLDLLPARAVRFQTSLSAMTGTRVGF